MKLSFRVEGAEVDLMRECVRRNGREYHLKPTTFQTLVYLINQRHRVVESSDLTSFIWRGKPGSEGALNDALAEIRDALGDSLRRQEFIRTVSDSSYRFVAPVQEMADEAVAGVAIPDAQPAANPNVRLITGVVFALGTLVSILIALAMSAAK